MTLYTKYQWQCNTGRGRKGCQNCDLEQSPGASSSTLTCRSHRCIVSNNAGSDISTVGETDDKIVLWSNFMEQTEQQ